MTVFSERQLLDIYNRLLEHFGPQQWWPADTQLEMVIGAILTQNTNWNNVEKALANLKQAEALSVAALENLDEACLQQLIKPSGFFRQKAMRLKQFIQYLSRIHQGDLGMMLAQEPIQLRNELLALNGIGPETADSIILYAGQQPTFVIDAYTVRLLQRLGLIDGNPGYEPLRRGFMQALPTDVRMFNEYHALIVRIGKIYCTRRSPRCARCPLRSICATGRQNLGPESAL